MSVRSGDPGLGDGHWARWIKGAGRRLVAPARRRVAFVLSGGGSLGAVQVGMLRALAEHDIRPDLIIGASVGAINGAAFAAEPDLAGVERLTRVWGRLAERNPDIMPTSRLPLVVQLARKADSVHDPKGLRELLDAELPVATFADLKVRFQCVATDVETASEFWFADGPVVSAVMASASLPAVYPPVQMHGRTLIDGGVLNELHTKRAVELGANEIYILHVGHLHDHRPEPIQRAFDGVTQAYWVARRRRYLENLEQIPRHCTVHLMPAGATPRLRFDDFSRATELAEEAYQHAYAYLSR